MRNEAISHSESSKKTRLPHVVICSLNFHPEKVGIGKYNSELVAWLVKHGYQITVITAPPYYPQWKVEESYQGFRYVTENWKGATVHRCPLYVPSKPSALKRIFHLLTFAISSFPVLLSVVFRQRPTLILLTEPPFFCIPAVLFTAWLGQTRSWLHVQDLEIDASLGLGMISRSWITDALHRVEGFLYRRFDRVSTISKKMLTAIVNKGVDPKAARLFPNWIDLKAYELTLGKTPNLELFNIDKSATVVLFSGTIGLKQGVDVLVSAARLLKDEKQIQFIICGEGPLRKELQAGACDMKNLHWLDFQSQDNFKYLLARAKIQVLTQLPGASDRVLPSKLLGMMASGAAVIATTEPESEIAEILKETGLIVRPNDPQALAETIKQLVGQQKQITALGQSAKGFATANWDLESVLGAFDQEVRKLCGLPPSREESDGANVALPATTKRVTFGK